MIRASDRDFFALAAEADAVACPVNCVGVMGAGLALAVVRRWPESVAEYEAGVVVSDRTRSGLRVYHVPTKRHWCEPSRFADVEAGAVALAHAVAADGVRSLVVPALGCGLGGLAWGDVEPMLRKVFADAPFDAFLARPRRCR